jgi:hypothetical protein
MKTITVPRALLEQAVAALNCSSQAARSIEEWHPIDKAVVAPRAALAAPQVAPWTSLHLGKFAISLHAGELTITHDSGEGGQFDAKKFEAHVAQFFNKEF